MRSAALEQTADLLELIERLVSDAKMAAGSLVIDGDLEAKAVRQGAFKRQRVRILLVAACRLAEIRVVLRADIVLGDALGITHRKPLGDDRAGQRRRIRRRNQRSRMPGRQRAFRQHVAHRFRQFQQSQAVCDVAAALADNFAEIVLRVTVFGNQLLIAERLVERVEIRALNVLDDRDLERRAIVDVTDNDRNLGESG
ncbi:hypothetical protein D9M72_487920 [compost metagenome]